MTKVPFNIDLTGKVAVITGAGGGLCSCFSDLLASCGAKVAMLGIHLESVQKIADEIVNEGKLAKAYRCDVLSKANLEAVHKQIVQDLGYCDILLNGAGGNNPRATTTNEYYQDGDLDKKDIITFFDLAPCDVELVFNLNFLGTLLPIQVFAPDMIAKGKGTSILNISSMNAYTPLTKIPAYSAAKAAISNFTQWLATYFAQSGIRVNAIAPGFFVTKQNQALLFNNDGTPTPRTAKILARTPMGRFGEREELNGAVQFLLSDEAASFVTGVVIPIDGGYSAYSGV